MRICVIDDNAMVSGSLAFVLRDKGHEVFEAATGPAGIEVVAGCGCDGVVVDFNLPGMRGDACAAEIRMRNPDIAIILTSGDAVPADAVGKGGADAFLDKPFTPNALLAAMADIIKSRVPAR